MDQLIKYQAIPIDTPQSFIIGQNALFNLQIR